MHGGARRGPTLAVLSQGFAARTDGCKVRPELGNRCPIHLSYGGERRKLMIDRGLRITSVIARVGDFGRRVPEASDRRWHHSLTKTAVSS
jgi:hypothetical protein